MSLETLSYKYIGKFIAPAVTLSGNMANIANAFASTTYADSSPRVTGSGVAWTPTSQLSSNITLAVALTPPTSSLGQKIIYAGGGAGSPTMLSPETYANSRVIFGVCKNAGNLGSWSDANPFGTGQFSGYTSAFVGNTTLSTIHVFESKDSVMIIGETNTNTMYYTLAGAIIDPESNNASVAESDGKIYGIITSGYNGAGGTPNWYANFGANSFLNHGGSLGQAHAYLMNIGASTTTSIKRANVLLSAPTAATNLKNTQSEFVRLPIYMDGGGTNFYGRLREILMFGNGLSITKLVVSNIVAGYILGANTTSTSECLFLKA